jgi:hypothetical protein
MAITIQVVIRFNVEQFQHLVKHLAVLGCYADYTVEVNGITSRFPDHRRHLDRFRAGAEY